MHSSYWFIVSIKSFLFLVILLTHHYFLGYFNVWQRFQAGYSSFVKRRAAVQKSAKLPSATSEQLKIHNDVCAICFMEMLNESNTVITPCNHFFHRVCLRRWLCFQDRCPLCTASITFVAQPKPEK